ncbi:MAG: hypothetical protein ACOCVS_01930 [Planctomycetota bacterium]
MPTSSPWHTIVRIALRGLAPMLWLAAIAGIVWLCDGLGWIDTPWSDADLAWVVYLLPTVLVFLALVALALVRVLRPRAHFEATSAMALEAAARRWSPRFLAWVHQLRNRAHPPPPRSDTQRRASLGDEVLSLARHLHSWTWLTDEALPARDDDQVLARVHRARRSFHHLLQERSSRASGALHAIMDDVLDASDTGADHNVLFAFILDRRPEVARASGSRLLCKAMLGQHDGLVGTLLDRGDTDVASPWGQEELTPLGTLVNISTRPEEPLAGRFGELTVRLLERGADPTRPEPVLSRVDRSGERAGASRLRPLAILARRLTETGVLRSDPTNWMGMVGALVAALPDDDRQTLLAEALGELQPQAEDPAARHCQTLFLRTLLRDDVDLSLPDARGCSGWRHLVRLHQRALLREWSHRFAERPLPPDHQELLADALSHPHTLIAVADAGIPLDARAQRALDLARRIGSDDEALRRRSILALAEDCAALPASFVREAAWALVPDLLLVEDASIHDRLAAAIRARSSDEDDEDAPCDDEGEIAALFAYDDQPGFDHPQSLLRVLLHWLAGAALSHDQVLSLFARLGTVERLRPTLMHQALGRCARLDVAQRPTIQHGYLGGLMARAVCGDDDATRLRRCRETLAAIGDASALQVMDVASASARSPQADTATDRPRDQVAVDDTLLRSTLPLIRLHLPRSQWATVAWFDWAWKLDQMAGLDPSPGQTLHSHITHILSDRELRDRLTVGSGLRCLVVDLCRVTDGIVTYHAALLPRLTLDATRSLFAGPVQWWHVEDTHQLVRETVPLERPYEPFERTMLACCVDALVSRSLSATTPPIGHGDPPVVVLSYGSRSGDEPAEPGSALWAHPLAVIA